MADSGKIDVIIPHLNYGRFLKQCLDSIRAQNADANIILVDGGSTDSTFEVLKDFPEVKVLTFVGEVRDAFLHGYRQTSADYVCFFSSDNVMLPNFLRDAKTILDSQPNVGLVYGYATQIDAEGREQGTVHGGEWSRNKIKEKNFVDSSEGMFRRSAWSGQYPDWLFCHPDWWIWREIAERYDAVYLNRPVILFRVHDQSFSNRRRPQIDAEYARIRQSREDEILHELQNAFAERDVLRATQD